MAVEPRFEQLHFGDCGRRDCKPLPRSCERLAAAIRGAEIGCDRRRG